MNSASTTNSLNLTELRFIVHQTATVEAYSLAGINGVTEANLDYVSAYLRSAGAADTVTPTLATLQTRVSDAAARVAKLEAWQGGDASAAWTRADLVAFGFEDLIAEDDINLDGLLSLLSDSATGSTYAEVVSALGNAAAAFDAQFKRLETYLTAGGVDTAAIEQDYVPDYDLTDAAKAGLVFEGTGAFYNGANYTKTAAAWGANNVFDKQYSSSTGMPNVGWHSSAGKPDFIGWKSPDLIDAQVLTRIVFDGRSGFGARVPKQFDVLGWNGAEWELIKEDLINTTFDYGSGVSIDVSYDANTPAKAYLGFAIRIDSSNDTGGWVNLDELLFYTKPAALAFDATQLAALGFDGLSADQAETFSALAEQANFAALNTASARYTYLETINANLTQLEAYFEQLALYAAGDDSQAPTLSDYQALEVLLDDLDIDFELGIDASVAAALDVALRVAGTLVDVGHTLRVMDVAVARYADATAKASDYLDRSSYTVGVEGSDANFLDAPLTSNSEGALASSTWSSLHAYRAFDGAKAESSTSTHQHGWFSQDNRGFAVLSLGGNTAGWDQSVTAEILKTIRIWPTAANSNWSNGVPEEFNVRGYNPVTDQWELIAYLQGPNTIQWPLEFDIESTTPYNGFRLELLDNIADHGEYDKVDFGFTEVEYITQSVGTVLTLADYQDLGFGDVTEELVQALNVRLAAETKPATISHSSLKPIVDDVLAQEAAIHAMIRHESSVTDTAVYADAGLVGVNASNIDRINELLISDAQGASQRLSDMQAAINHQNHQFAALFDLVNAINNDASNYGKALGDGTFVDHNMTSSSPLIEGIVSAKEWYGGGWNQQWRLFDGAISSSNGYASDKGVGDVYAGEPEGLIGIYDINQMVGPRVLDSVSVNLRNNGEITTGFWIQGYNSTWQRWENIHYSDSHSTNAATQTINVDSDKAYSGFRLYLEAADSDLTVIEELWFNTKGTDLFAEAGIQGVNAYNVAFVSAALVTAQASDATLFSSNTALQQAVDTAREDFLISEINRVINDNSETLTADFYLELGFDDIGEVSRSYLDQQWRDAASSGDLSDIAAMTAFVSQQLQEPSALMTLLAMESTQGAEQTAATALVATSELKGYVPLLTSGDKNAPEIIENNPFPPAEYKAWRLFDGSGGTFFADNGQLSSANPLLLGYQGEADAWTRIQSFSYEYREEYVNRTPKDFTLQGLNPLTNTWIDIQSYFNTSTQSDQTFNVTSQAARQPFVGYRLRITSANGSTDSNSKVNLDALQFNVQDVVVDSSLFTALELPMVTAETSNDILVALLTDATLDLTDRTAVLGAARAEALSLGIDQYVLNAGVDVEAPTAAELVEAGFADVTDANVAMVLEALASSQADGLSIAQAVATGVQVQPDAFTNLTENFDGTSQIFQGEGALFVPMSGTGGAFSFTSQWNATDHKFANAFDRNTATFWANNHALSEANPEQAAWVSNDPNYLGVIRQIEIDVRDAHPDRLPAAFDVEGWNATTGQWEFIQSFTDSTLSGIERFAVASNKAYSGFRLMITASQKGDNNHNSNINVDEIRFVVEPIATATDFDYVSTDPTLLTYKQAGIGGVTINNIDRINAGVKAAIDAGMTLDFDAVTEIVFTEGWIQNVVDTDSAVESDATQFATLEAAAEDLFALQSFATKAEYDAQVATGVELTADELSLLAGQALSTAEAQSAIEDLITASTAVRSQETLQQLVQHEAYLTDLLVIDQYGNAVDEVTSGNTLEAVIALDESLVAGDSVELIIDGVVVDTKVLTTEDVAAHQAQIEVNTDDLADASLVDNELDFVVRVTQASTGTTDETEQWTYNWQ